MLVVVTALEVAVTYFPAIPQAPTLISLAILKFFLIASIYMHLRYDSRVFSAFFMIGLILATGMLVSFLASSRPTPGCPSRPPRRPRRRPQGRAVARRPGRASALAPGRASGEGLPVAEGAEWVRWPFVPDIVLGLMALVVLYALARGACGGRLLRPGGPAPPGTPRGP